FIRRSIVRRIFSYVSKILNVRWSIKGVENLKLNESCVLVANHQNNLDVLGVSQIYAHLETSCVALANDDCIYSGPFGLCARLNRFTLINESDELFSHKNLLPSKIKQLKHDNVSILIFPEIINNRSDEGIRDFQKSAFILAIKEQLPIVPVVFSNYYFIDNHRKVFDPGYVTIEAISPIRTDNLSIDDVSKLIEETRNKMRTTMKKLTAKLTPPSVKELRKQYTF
ncbi:1-acyl-sn-glycerol-3-phosphate acyltransferase beta-like, partial [Planococcus citri]|uniref:1-acyl-sn-glycerol-3-phosphate acyltransferase beta-like n=1 Tax=Planococcus citri TaxID=170843 RepID=UPI0031F9EE9B